MIRVPSAETVYKMEFKNIKPLIAPKEVEETILNDKEINEVMSYLLFLQDEYFSDVPLDKELCKQFIWNIPRKVYDAFDRSRLLDEPDVLNPLFCLYIYCVEDPYRSISKFVDKLTDMICDDYTIQDMIQKRNKDYDNLMSENDEEDNED